MKTSFLHKIVAVAICITPLMLGAQEEPASEPTSLPVSPSPLTTPEATPSKPTFDFVFGIYSQTKKKHPQRGLFARRSSREVPSQEDKPDFTIGVTESGAAWKILGEDNFEGPFPSVEELLLEEKIHIRQMYCIDYPKEKKLESVAKK
jgi:hypothetical protein